MKPIFTPPISLTGDDGAARHPPLMIGRCRWKIGMLVIPLAPTSAPTARFATRLRGESPSLRRTCALRTHAVLLPAGEPA